MIRTLALALAALALTGCSGDDTGNPYADVNVPDVDVKSIARDALREQEPALFGSMSDPAIDNVYEVTCEGFDNGLAAEDVAMAGMPSLGSAVGAVMMGAVTAYCPEHRLLVDVWMDQYS